MRTCPRDRKRYSEQSVNIVKVRAAHIFRQRPVDLQLLQNQHVQHHLYGGRGEERGEGGGGKGEGGGGRGGRGGDTSRDNKTILAQEQVALSTI